MPEPVLPLMHGRSGHFRLESGHHGDLRLDPDAVFVRPTRLLPLVRTLADRLARHRIDLVCGPLTGGAFLAQLIAAELDVDFCCTERVAAPQADELFSARYELVGAAIAPGCRVAIVDDVINAGSAVRSTVACLQDRAAAPTVLGALLVLGSSAAGLAASLGVPLESLERAEASLWSPSDCPACAAGVPLEDVTAG
ncbi:MAG TPA: phosphoribosyltransferase family protein [Mycobacteriales bacterium]|nr:phosphoribosyltransferase family protein [Mycobacteriales bacterium]